MYWTYHDAGCSLFGTLGRKQYCYGQMRCKKIISNKCRGPNNNNRHIEEDPETEYYVVLLVNTDKINAGGVHHQREPKTGTQGPTARLAKRTVDMTKENNPWKFDKLTRLKKVVKCISNSSTARLEWTSMQRESVMRNQQNAPHLYRRYIIYTFCVNNAWSRKRQWFILSHVDNRRK